MNQCFCINLQPLIKQLTKAQTKLQWEQSTEVRHMFMRVNYKMYVTFRLRGIKPLKRERKNKTDVFPIVVSLFKRCRYLHFSYCAYYQVVI